MSEGDGWRIKKGREAREVTGLRGRTDRGEFRLSVEKWFESKDTRGRRRKKRRGRNVIDREVQRGAKEVEARAKIGEQSKEEESIETKRERQLEGR